MIINMEKGVLRISMLRSEAHEITLGLIRDTKYKESSSLNQNVKPYYRT